MSGRLARRRGPCGALFGTPSRSPRPAPTSPSDATTPPSRSPASPSTSPSPATTNPTAPASASSQPPKTAPRPSYRWSPPLPVDRVERERGGGGSQHPQRAGGPRGGGAGGGPTLATVNGLTPAPASGAGA